MDQQAHHWGMAIDLDLCTGCQACVVACRAENNIPSVGEEEIVRGRSLHWIRIERYWRGEEPYLQAHFMPLLCQQCQHAPCEPVCPLYASVHEVSEGLNVQVYNRCIGTRLCAINCPYKVRQFNWFDPDFPEPLTEQLNPDVTVRRRGIMDKCSFCIQRIRRAREEAAGGAIPDGTVQPACVQTSDRRPRLWRPERPREPGGAVGPQPAGLCAVGGAGDTALRRLSETAGIGYR